MSSIISTILVLLFILSQGVYSGAIDKPIISQTKPISSSSTTSSTIPERRGKITLPVLMYHSISDNGSNNPVPPSTFEKHMQYLDANGWTPITTTQLQNYINNKSDLPEKPILLTFDDGWKDNYDNAYKILNKYNFKGNFAIITGNVGEADRVSWDNLREMQKAGHEISSHSDKHCYLTVDKKDWQNENFRFADSPISDVVANEGCFNFYDWRVLDTSRIRYEMKLSKEKLEKELGTQVNAIVYPYGKYNKQVMNIVEEVGYKFGFTTQGQNYNSVNLDSTFDIPRRGMYGSTPLNL
jgi:peptidoglycan/xylan/chitin deacetylase (PgdA/CDA1 family)